MRIQFDAKQEYQLDAIRSVVDLFEGQFFNETRLGFMPFGGFAVVPNELSLTEADVIENLQRIQADNSLPTDDALSMITETTDTAEGAQEISFPNFSVEMETGTGKTYVYIRTALELAQRYGMRKFIIVVPTVAIREGVLKTFEITQKHFRELYSNLPYRYYVYDSSALSRLKQFGESDNVEFMVMTMASFNKDSNVIRQGDRDQMFGVTPLHVVQAARPILILDEPQNMGSDLSKQALASLNPLFALRYSATHREDQRHNQVYRLSPFDAYRLNLVKKIEVAGIERTDDANHVFMRLEELNTKKRTITARITVHVLRSSGTVAEKTITFKPDGKSLFEKTNLPDYRPFIIEEIDISQQIVRFTNGTVLRKGDSTGDDKEAVFEAQIRYTIETHFRRQQQLRDEGIKVLSLFFIDRVDNYVQETGIIRVLFNRIFNELKQKPDYRDQWGAVDPETVQGGYFASRNTREGDVIYEDSKTGEAERDKEVYDAIMRDKEALLSFPSPDDDDTTRRKKQLTFIFSHSALREGWDNPNVFQICTLNQSVSNIKKRQEIGRGIRLSVDQTGERVHNERVNVLTVVANQSYETYVQTLQSEIEEEYGRDGLAPKPSNARRRGSAKLRKAYTLKPEFKELWERIKHKTRYHVQIDTDQLAEDVIAELDQTDIRPPRVTVSRARVEVDEGDSERFGAMATSIQKDILARPASSTMTNVIKLMTHMLQFTSPPVRLTRKTLLHIFNNTAKQSDGLANPQEFASTTVRIIKAKLADQLVDGIRYERINDWYEMTQFEAEIDSWEEYLVPQPDEKPLEKSLYDHVVSDSNVETQFVRDLESMDEVKLYVKLPSWFTVPTPVGEYNPDWAIVIEPHDAHGQPTGEQMTYLVSETKSTTDREKLRPDERRKIDCGTKHFQDALNVRYRHVSRARDLFDE